MRSFFWNMHGSMTPPSLDITDQSANSAEAFASIHNNYMIWMVSKSAILVKKNKKCFVTFCPIFSAVNTGYISEFD